MNTRADSEPLKRPPPYQEIISEEKYEATEQEILNMCDNFFKNFDFEDLVIINIQRYLDSDRYIYGVH